MCGDITRQLPYEFKRKWKGCFDFTGSYWRTHSEVKLYVMGDFWKELHVLLKEEIHDSIAFTCWADESEEGYPDVVMVFVGEDGIRSKRAAGWADDYDLFL